MSEQKPHNVTAADSAASSGLLLGPEAELQVHVLDDFELRSEIGHGGMGTVYEAWQRSLGRRVALKILARHVSDSPNSVLRFQREAHAAAKLHHPHIIPIFAQGAARGYHYYAMELIDGQSLYDIIVAARRRREQAQPAIGDTDETVTLERSGSGGGSATRLSDVRGSRASSTGASSVSAGTSSSVTLNHPVSATITQSAVGGQTHYENVARHIALLADALDYAHEQGVVHRDIKPHNLLMGRDGRMLISDFGLARLAEQPGVTVTGELIGSPLYMSREQVVADGDLVDGRTDIYSLGATMYEWLTLQPAFPGETREQVISKIVQTDPPPMRPRLPDLPVDLETICLKAMEKHAEHRYQLGREMAEDLRRFLAQRPIAARRAGWAQRAFKFVRRHPVAVLAVAAVAVAASLTAALTVSSHNVQEQATRVQEAQTRAEQAESETEQILKLIDALPPEMMMLVKGADAVGPMVEGLVETGQQVSSGTGMVRTGGANPAAVGTVEGLARRAVREMFNASSPPRDDSVDLDIADARLLLLDQARVTADPGEGLEMVETVLEMAPDDLEAHQLRAVLHAEQEAFDQMVADVEAWLPQHEGVASSYVWHGLAVLLAGDLERSLADLDNALRLDGLSVWAHCVRGLALLASERELEAQLEFNNVLTLAGDHSIALLGRAVAYARADNLEEAVADIGRVIELEPANADALALRGEHLVTLRHFDDAVDDFERAMTIAGRNPATALQTLLTRAKAHFESEGSGGSGGSESEGPALEGVTPTGSPGDAGFAPEDAGQATEGTAGSGRAGAVPGTTGRPTSDRGVRARTDEQVSGLVLPRTDLTGAEDGPQRAQRRAAARPGLRPGIGFLPRR